MKFVRTAIIAGAASAALAGAALAAGGESKMMLVALPDGSVQHIRYQGEVAPRVLIVRDAAPVDLFSAAFGPGSVFAEMERMSAAMEAHSMAMMRQAALMQAQMPAADGAGDAKGVVMTNAAGQPVGVMHYSYVSSTTGADGCTRTVRVSSDGGTADQPRVIRTSAGSCGSDQLAPGAKPVTPTTAPAARPAPKIIPVSASKPRPEFAFTPSRI
jgi:hypothetical protein